MRPTASNGGGDRLSHARVCAGCHCPMKWRSLSLSGLEIEPPCRPEGSLDLSEITRTSQALQAGTHLTEAAASGSKLGPADQSTAERVLDTPVVAQVSRIAVPYPPRASDRPCITTDSGWHAGSVVCNARAADERGLLEEQRSRHRCIVLSAAAGCHHPQTAVAARSGPELQHSGPLLLHRSCLKISPSLCHADCGCHWGGATHNGQLAS